MEAPQQQQTTTPTTTTNVVVGQSDPKNVYSNVAKTGEWKTRKINLWGLLRSFISQLKLGQDLTKISLPCELCHPYSMLEVMGQRELTLFNVLYELNDTTDPLSRFMIVVKYFLSMMRQETFEKKPYNPILGETHLGFSTDGVNGTVEFISEQVSHHPPISAFNVINEQHQLEVAANITFGVKFGGNTVTVATSGGAVLHAHKLAETYSMTRCIPDMIVRNVVWGKKYIIWSGDCIISCPETGYVADLVFKEAKNQDNVVEGVIKMNVNGKEDIIGKIEGICGGATRFFKKDDVTKELVDVSKLKMMDPQYLPADKLEPLSSVMVWGKVNEHVIAGDMSKADTEKQFVEDQQRKRRAERAASNQQFVGQYFTKNEDEGLWKVQKKFSLKRYLNNEIDKNGLELITKQIENVTLNGDNNSTNNNINNVDSNNNSNINGNNNSVIAGSNNEVVKVKEGAEESSSSETDTAPQLSTTGTTTTS